MNNAIANDANTEMALTTVLTTDMRYCANCFAALYSA